MATFNHKATNQPTGHAQSMWMGKIRPCRTPLPLCTMGKSWERPCHCPLFAHLNWSGPCSPKISPISATYEVFQLKSTSPEHQERRVIASEDWISWGKSFIRNHCEDMGAGLAQPWGAEPWISLNQMGGGSRLFFYFLQCWGWKQGIAKPGKHPTATLHAASECYEYSYGMGRV